MKKSIHLITYVIIGMAVMAVMVMARARAQSWLTAYFEENANAFFDEAERNAIDMTHTGLFICIPVLLERVVNSYIRVAHPRKGYIANCYYTLIYVALGLLGLVGLELLWMGAKYDEIAGWQALGAAAACIYLFPAVAWLLHFAWASFFALILPTPLPIIRRVRTS